MEEELELVQPSRFNIKKTVIIVFIVAVVLLTLFFGIKAFRITKKIIISKSSTASPYLTEGVDFINNLSPDNIIKEGDRRINILLLGIGGGDHDGPNLTDTIMVVSIDPKNKGVAMLSVPRDLYVDVEKIGSTKINAVYSSGKNYYESEEEGLKLAKDTVSSLLGVPIHYFALVNFDGFEKVIDILGGVEINVEKDLYDPLYPDKNLEGYEEFSISKGVHIMDGETALKYARSRETTSDFDRAKRQQTILLAVKDKVTKEQNLFNIRKITQIINTLSDNIRMDIQISEIEELSKIMKDIKSENISVKVIDDSPDGLVYADRLEEMYVLLPNDSTLKEMHDFVRQYFKDPFIVNENATISVKNGTKKDSLAKIFGEELTSFGYNVVSVSNAEKRDYQKTFIYDYSNNKKKYTINFLKDKLGDAPVIKLDGEGNGCDIEVIIGEDHKGKP